MSGIRSGTLLPKAVTQCRLIDAMICVECLADYPSSKVPMQPNGFPLSLRPQGSESTESRRFQSTRVVHKLCTSSVDLLTDTYRLLFQY